MIQDVLYQTDLGQEIIIRINYRTDDWEQRLALGGFELSLPLIPPIYDRSWIKPRWVELKDKKKIFFKTRAIMEDYILNNLDSVCRSQGETLGAKYYSSIS